MEKRFIGQLLIIFVFYLFGITSIPAQNKRQNNRKKTNVEKFILSPFIEAAYKDSIRVITFIEIPFNSLSFIKKEDTLLLNFGYQGIMSSIDALVDDEHFVWRKN